MLAGIDRSAHRGIGGAFRAANQFDEDVGSRIAREFDRIGEPAGAGKIDGPRLLAVAGGDAGNGNRAAGADREVIAMPLDEGGER